MRDCFESVECFMARKSEALKNVDSENPFLLWMAALWERRALTRKGKDYLLDEFGGKRFGIGIDSDGTPVLGVLVEDTDAILSVNWSSAAFIRGHMDKDWIALATKDIRIENSQAEFPIPIRLWIPIPDGVIDAFFQYNKDDHKILRLRKLKRINFKPMASRTILKEIPLLYNDKEAKQLEEV